MKFNKRGRKLEERLQKYLANSGVASRRKCEEFIIDGRVKVNGKVVTELGTKINPDKDIIEFDGKKVEKVEKHVYILLNKPIIQKITNPNIIHNIFLFIILYLII